MCYREGATSTVLGIYDHEMGNTVNIYGLLDGRHIQHLVLTVLGQLDRTLRILGFVE